MKEESEDGESNLGLIPLHFQVPEHSLPLRDFIATATSASDLLEALNQEVLGGKLKFQVLVVPPKPGTFLELLAVAIVGGGALWGFVGSDIGKGFVEGLTGKPPAEWAKSLGRYFRSKLLDDSSGELLTTSEQVDSIAMQKFEVLLIGEIFKAFLTENSDKLHRLGITPKSFREAFEARNSFFQACQNNKKVQAIGFTEEEEFPLKRRDFAAQLVALPAKLETEKPLEWVVGVERVIVPSPMWSKELQARRGWFGKYGDGKEAHFVVEDEEFWLKRDTGVLHLKPNDHLRVQWAYIEARGRRSQFRVLRVLDFNDQSLSQPLSDEALRAILGGYTSNDDDQHLLFDD